jgi:hypothetical protein
MVPRELGQAERQALLGAPRVRPERRRAALAPQAAARPVRALLQEWAVAAERAGGTPVKEVLEP